MSLASHLRGRGALLVALATSVTLLALTRSELAIAREPLNDLALHIPLAGRISEAFRGGENPLDAWCSEWSLGHPVPRTYQPLASAVVGGTHALLAGRFSIETVFVVFHWLLIGLLPLSLFAGARRMGLTPAQAACAAAMSPLISTDLLFGLELGSTCWRGSGLFTQSWAQVLLPLSIGWGVRHLRDRGQLAPAALLLSLTFAAHFVYGLMGAISLVLAALLPAPPRRGAPAASETATSETGTSETGTSETGTSETGAAEIGTADSESARYTGTEGVPRAAVRLLRLAALGALTFGLSAWLLVPLLLDREFVNRSRWEAAWKWDSFAPKRFAELVTSGDLLDHGRFPALSLVVLAGVLVVSGRMLFGRASDAERFVGAGAILWLLLLAGRGAWDGLYDLLGMGDVPLHRFIGGTHLFLLLLAACGLAAIARAPPLVFSRLTWKHAPAASAILGVLLGFLAVSPAVAERLLWLKTGREWGAETIRLTDAERDDLGRAIALCRQRGGRAYAGPGGDWGKDFGIKWTPMHAFLSRARVSQVSFLYHAMALTSDVMVRFSDWSAAHWRLFGVTTALAPPDRELAPFTKEIARFGRFRVLEGPGEGMFDVVDVVASVRCDRLSFYDVVDPWLTSRGPAQRRHLALDLAGRHPEPGFPSLPADTRLPEDESAGEDVKGAVLGESRDGERYSASVRVDAERAWLLFKMTWHPGWRATVDGRDAPTSHLTPGFVGVRLAPGEHEVELRYEPGRLKTILLLMAPALLAGVMLIERRGWPRLLERRAAPVLAAAGARLAASPSVRELAGVLLLALLAGLPLLLPGLGSGHDAVAYPPRVVELHENLRHGILVPRWAPDLSAGHGQPFFLYTPPLPGWIAAPIFAATGDVARALGLAAFLVLAIGILAMRRAALEIAGPAASWVAATAFALAPYVLTDIHVRAAYAETTALALSPIALLGLLRHARTGSARDLGLAAIGVALVGLSHHASALVLVPSLVVLVIARAPSRRAAFGGAGAVVLGVLAAACAWLPGLLEADLVKLHLAREDYFHWRTHLVEPWQLLWSRWGFGLSLQGDADDMSFRLGPVHLLLAAIAGACAVDAARRDGARSAPRLRLIALLLAGVLVVSALMTPFGAPAWEHLPLLSSLQFPWRLSGLVTLMLALLAALACDGLRARFPAWARRGVAPAIVIALVVTGYPLARPANRTHPDPAALTPEELASRGSLVTSVEELEPATVESRAPWTSELATTVAGDAKITIDRRSPELWSLRVQASEPSRITLRLHDFPGWTLQGAVAGADAGAGAGAGAGLTKLPPEPFTGRVRLAAEPGEHDAELRLRRSGVQWAGIAISAVALAAILVLATRRRGTAGGASG